LTTKFWGVVDMDSILSKGFVATGILWLMGIDRHLIESTTSATQWFQRDREYTTPYPLEITS